MAGGEKRHRPNETLDILVIYRPSIRDVIDRIRGSLTSRYAEKVEEGIDKTLLQESLLYTASHCCNPQHMPTSCSLLTDIL